MIKDYFFNPQSSYDLTTRGGSNWICNDGTTDGSATTGWLSEASAKEGRQLNYCDASKTPQPTPYPTATTTTKRPTNKPVTPRPTPDPTTVPPTPAPVDAPTPQPVENVVTARPTKKQPTPQPLEPSTSSTMKPTSFPTTSTTTTPAPVPTTAECSIQDCTFDVKVEWVSEAQVYQGFANYVWNRQKQLTGLANKGGWRAGYSWGGNYRKNAKNNWELYIYDDVGTDFSEMECTWRDVLIAYMRDGEQGGDEGTEGGTYFKDAMKSLILSDMTDAYGSNPGYVDAVTVVVTCTTTDAAAFGAIDEDGNIELPFSTWNLNTYDFSDWFVLLFVLFTGCACCFGCGWAMHRRRVFKAMDDASISDFNANPEAPMVTMDGNASPQNITTTDDYHNATYATNEPEIEIGVSVNSNNHGIMAEDSE